MVIVDLALWRLWCITVFLFLITKSVTQTPKPLVKHRYGNNSAFWCHCYKDVQCDLVTGKCPDDDHCAEGYFGSSCQFERIGLLIGSNPWLADSDHSTCNPKGLTYIYISYKFPYTLDWIRLIFSKTQRIGEVSVVYTEAETKKPCPQGQQVNRGKVMDIYCPSDRNIFVFYLMGKGVMDLCEVYVNKGRNIALGAQTVIQSSTEDGHTAAKAVDGYLDSGDPSVLVGCSLTNPNPRPPWWIIEFEEPENFFGHRLYNREGCCQERLANLFIYLYDRSGQQMIRLVTNSDHKKVINHWSSIPHKGVKRVKISFHKHVKKEPLSICEVILYGGPCPTMRYGPQCAYKCGPCLGDFCNHITGACAKGCPEGLYGKFCTDDSPEGPVQEETTELALFLLPPGLLLIAAIVYMVYPKRVNQTVGEESKKPAVRQGIKWALPEQEEEDYTFYEDEAEYAEEEIQPEPESHEV